MSCWVGESIFGECSEAMKALFDVLFIFFFQQEVDEYRYFDPKMLRVTDRCGLFLLFLAFNKNQYCTILV